MANQVQVFDALVSPPYFYAAVVSPNEEVLKVFIHPVYFHGSDFFLVDSQKERGFGSDLLNRRRVFYKPPGTMEFYESLPEQQRLLGIDRWRYEPDFIEYDAQFGSGQIDEVVGFSQQHTAYHRHLAEKRAYWEPLIFGTRVRYDDRICGADYHGTIRSGVRMPDFGPFPQRSLPRLTPLR